jgi:hypothetical protein
VRVLYGAASCYIVLHRAQVKPEELEKKKKAAEEVLAAESAAELPPPPSMADNVAVSLFKAPLTITYAAMWVMQGGLREPGYMTRKALGASSQHRHDATTRPPRNAATPRPRARRATKRRRARPATKRRLVCPATKRRRTRPVGGARCRCGGVST